MDLSISNEIKKAIPSFKIGMITYHDITVTETPQFLKGRFQLLMEEWLLKNEEVATPDIPGIKEWRELFKIFGTDPSRYRPSHEALIRRLRKDRDFPSIHTGADVNNYFSVLYEIPMGLYDFDKIQGHITIRIGASHDSYLGINGRVMSLSNKLISAHDLGPFGSPIVDSKQTMVTGQTKHAVQILYLRPSLDIEICQQGLENIGKTFVQFNGGEMEASIID